MQSHAFSYKGVLRQIHTGEERRGKIYGSDVTTSHGMPAATRSYRGNEQILSESFMQECCPATTLISNV